jgi:acyl-coenzyme A thioesterase PaaI-like protein
MSAVTVIPTGPAALLHVSDLRQEGDVLTGVAAAASVPLGADDRPAVGALGVLVDEVLGYALMASLEPGEWSMSTELWIDLLSVVPPDELVASGRATSPGAFASGHVATAAGRLVAECRHRGRRTGRPERLAPAWSGPSDPGATLSDILGLGVSADGAAGSLPITTVLVNPSEVLHGGMSLAACEALATTSRVHAGCDLPTTSVHVVHTGAAPLGAVADLQCRTVRSGRSLWLTDVSMTCGDRLVATARVTAQE